MTCPGDTNLEAENRLVVARHVGDNGERALMHEVFLRGDENGLKLAGVVVPCSSPPGRPREPWRGKGLETQGPHLSSQPASGHCVSSDKLLPLADIQWLPTDLDQNLNSSP